MRNASTRWVELMISGHAKTVWRDGGALGALRNPGPWSRCAPLASAKPRQVAPGSGDVTHGSREHEDCAQEALVAYERARMGEPRKGRQNGGSPCIGGSRSPHALESTTLAIRIGRVCTLVRAAARCKAPCSPNERDQHGRVAYGFFRERRQVIHNFCGQLGTEGSWASERRGMPPGTSCPDVGTMARVDCGD